MQSDDTDSGFTLEVTRFAPDPVTESQPVALRTEFDAAVGRYDAEREVVFGLVCDEGAGGAFYMFVAGGRAWVHLTAGPCVTARSRGTARAAGVVVFRLDTGERREVEADRTVSREQGMQALRHWFCTEQQSPELAWTPAEPDAPADGRL